MIKNLVLKSSLVIAIVASSLMSPMANAQTRPDKPQACRKPEYPKVSLQRNEAGISVLAFLVKEDGTVGRSLIMVSSGHEDLDIEAQTALERCKFTAPSNLNELEGKWYPVAYNWVLEIDQDSKLAKHDNAVEAKKGNVQALMQLSMLLKRDAKTDQEKKRAFLLMEAAANKGEPFAQYQMGIVYEKGLNVDTNVEVANTWFQKSADNGNVLAQQRVKTGSLEF